MTDDRPRPLHEAADDAARVQGMWAGVSTAVVSAGLISLTTNNLIVAVLGIIPGLLALVGTIFGARAVANKAAPLVTPLSDPRDDDLRPLVPAAFPPSASEPAEPVEPAEAPEQPESTESPDSTTRPTRRRPRR